MENKEIYLTMQGVFKLTLFTFLDTPFDGKKIIPLTKKFLKIISNNGYGLSEMQLYAKIRLMSKDELNTWIDTVYNKFIDDKDIEMAMSNLM